MSEPLDSADTVSVIKRELLAAWNWWRLKNPTHSFYGFGMFSTDTATTAGAIAFSEQCLSEKTAAYASRYNSSPDLHRRSLRWSTGDSPFLADGLHRLPQTRQRCVPDALLDPDADELVLTQAVEAFFSAGLLALKELDEEGAFGTGSAREAIIISIWLHDESHEMKVEVAAELNSPSAVERYSAELEDGLLAFNTFLRERAKA